MTVEFSDQGQETEWMKFQVSFLSIMTLNGTWFTQFPNPTYLNFRVIQCSGYVFSRFEVLANLCENVLKVSAW